MRTIMRIAVAVSFCLAGSPAIAANSVSVQSKTVTAGASNVEIGITLVNDIPLQAIVIPLEIRTVTNGAYIDSMKMSYAGRLDSTLTALIYTVQLGSKGLNCKWRDPGFGEVLYSTRNVKHPVGSSPEAALFARAKVRSLPLPAGADAVPSMFLTVDIGPATGTFEIDTTCTTQNNHLVFLGDATGGQPYAVIVPAFTKGVITVAACNCAHHGDLNGDNAVDVLDVSLLIDYVFGGSPIPITDPGCPHVDRGDVNCSGMDDIFDVIYLNEYIYNSGPGPCNPCACSPYPTNCP